MSDNDILAEYVRQNHPNIANSVEFTLYRFSVRFREAVIGIANGVSEMLAAEIDRKEPDDSE